MTFRSAIPDFQLANPIYAAARVTFYTVDANGAATATLATLYASPIGATTLANPQTLDSEGKFSMPVYADVAVIAEAVGPNVASHRTGAIHARGTWRGNWATATVYFSTDFVQDPQTSHIYIVNDNYTSSATLAADVAASHLEKVIDQTTLTAAPLASGLWGPFTNVASAATCDIGATATVFVNITGTTGITSLGAGTNRFRVVKTASSVTFTNGANLVCPAGDYISRAGESFIAVSDAGAVWTLLATSTFTALGPNPIAMPYLSKLRRIRSLLDHTPGDGEAEDAIKIQALFDSFDNWDLVEIVCDAPAGGFYNLGYELRIKKHRLILVGKGGPEFRYTGPASADAAVIRVDKSIDHGGENYLDVKLLNLTLNGNGKALYAFRGHGFTQRCEVSNSVIREAVCPVKLTDGYYSIWNDDRIQASTQSPPSGMLQATFDANKYGTYLNVCHAAKFRGCTWEDIGGSSVGNIFDAVVRIGDSNAISFTDGCTFEHTSDAFGQHVTRILHLDPGVEATFQDLYLELLRTAGPIIEVEDGSSFSGDKLYVNQVAGTALLEAPDHAPLKLTNSNGVNLDLSDRLFKASVSVFTNLDLTGSSFAAGPQDGSALIYDGPATTNSKQGLHTDPILLANSLHTAATGYVKRGYPVTLNGNYVEIGYGEAVVNGQPVSFGRFTGLKQRLAPDLTQAATWNVCLGSAGAPYIEMQSAPKSGSSYALVLATFTTAGGGAAPAGLTAIARPVTKQTGTIEHPNGGTRLLSKTISGEAALVDSGVAATTNLLTITLPSTAGNDDSVAVKLEYTLDANSGAYHSREIGVVQIVAVRDNAGTVTASLSQEAAQQTSGGMTMASQFAASVASNVATITAKNETSQNVNGVIRFTATIVGAGRAATTVDLASGVTRLV